ncbi:unnamed protein product [Didymodactylos carnosus]|uniref:Uncharacterized protein n=1 Tax=Didymodactylos carnosus TaxID=1234261 RepID=A0A815B1I8_9BILA|nr:unnamed protein product [Didymodactylos carnosus]CAF4052079.1 unnamed protein product [Didymodactylos carnosus]
MVTIWSASKIRSRFLENCKERDIMDGERLPTLIESADVVVDKIVEQSTENVIDDFNKQKQNDNLNINNCIPEMSPLLNTNNQPNTASVDINFILSEYKLNSIYSCSL